MYNDYFGFREAPFSIAPDPRYLYMTAQHRDALAHLVYGLNSEGGCILLTGEVGTGKTTICRCLLEQIPEQANVALVLNPKVNEIELLETICDELKISYPDATNSIKTYTDRIYDFLIESNRRNEKTVLIIDEAQNLDSTVLEQLRLLTNLETNQRKLLQIIILGQPELLDILARPEMRQLAQRITARFHLRPLTRDEVKAYISHRLAVAGQNVQLFPENCIKLLFKLSNGVPRLINVICDRALLGAYVENQYNVTPPVLKKAATEVFGELKNVSHTKEHKRGIYPLATVASLLVLLFAVLSYFIYSSETSPDSRQVPEQDITGSTTSTGTYAESGPVPEQQPSEPPITDATPQPANQITGNFDITTETPETPEKSGAEYDDIDKILAGASGDPASAYQALFNAWGVQYNNKINMTACNQAEIYTLRCLFMNGNLNILKLHDRPAVLTLTNSEGNNRYITLTSIDNELATINSNNHDYIIRLNDLDKYWYGEFILLWRKPEHYTLAIKPGARGNIVNWLNNQLSSINGTTTTETVYRYNNRLVDEVKSFQTQQGLTADGIVGPVTVIHLNTESGSNVPTLNATQAMTQSDGN